MLSPVVNVKFLSEEAKNFGLPYYRHAGDAGVDLYTILPEGEREGKIVFPGERVMFHSGIAIGLEAGYWAFITHRSSTEKRKRLRVVTGVIDEGYTGELLVQVSNDNSFPVVVSHGERLAQLIVLPRINAKFSTTDCLTHTSRGSDGFGSTGSMGVG